MTTIQELEEKHSPEEIVEAFQYLHAIAKQHIGSRTPGFHQYKPTDAQKPPRIPTLVDEVNRIIDSEADELAFIINYDFVQLLIDNGANYSFIDGNNAHFAVALLTANHAHRRAVEQGKTTGYDMLEDIYELTNHGLSVDVMANFGNDLIRNFIINKDAQLLALKVSKIKDEKPAEPEQEKSSFWKKLKSIF